MRGERHRHIVTERERNPQTARDADRDTQIHSHKIFKRKLRMAAPIEMYKHN